MTNDIERADHPNTMRNVEASYVRDGYSKKDAVREAQKWRERMARAAEEVKSRQATG